ncbi:hypothetical protein FHS08_000834 [Microbacterium ulmi]|nr:hypothetical protein [Microbacterium ulmi]
MVPQEGLSASTALGCQLSDIAAVGASASTRSRSPVHVTNGTEATPIHIACI